VNKSMSFKSKIKQFARFARELACGFFPKLTSKTNKVINDPLFVLPKGVLARLVAGYKVSRSLVYGTSLNTEYYPNFDSEWYIEQYADVAVNSSPPFFHFVFHGRNEGRLPYDSRLDKYDSLLWLGRPELMLTKIKHMLSSLEEEELVARALWYLGRWYNYNGDTQNSLFYAKELFSVIETFHGKPNKPFLILVIDVFTTSKELELASDALNLLDFHYPQSNESFLLKSNIECTTRGSSTSAVEYLNQIFLANSCLPVALSQMDYLEACQFPRAQVIDQNSESPSSLVSVIVPAYNAAGELASTLNSLVKQTYRNIEIIVVNDASTDNTAKVFKQWSTANTHHENITLRYIENEKNEGAYFSRNKGMQLARGTFLTVNDADDWAHPQKLQFQVSALNNDSIYASISSCTRVTKDYLFKCNNIEQNWIQRNVSSLMIRRDVLLNIGFWDEVKANADTEYYYRLESKLGKLSIKHVLPNVPLSLQLVRKSSLTHSSVIGLKTQFEGARKWYMDAALRWHQNNVEDLKLAPELKERPFRAPNELIGSRQVNPHDSLEEIRQSGLWDAAWYVQRYQDLQEGGIDPFQHFISRGLAELRDPGPLFSLSSYILSSACAPENAIINFASSRNEASYYVGELEGYKASDGKANVLLVGHQAKQAIFGAERSLLDLAKLLSKLKYNVFVLLPEALNRQYIEQLKEFSSKIIIAPYSWWFEGKQANPETIEIFQNVLTENEIDVVHVNTLVLDEPLIAAKSLGIKSLVHIREDLLTDSALCNAMMCSPAQAIERLIEYDCNILCNSYYCLTQTKMLLPKTFTKSIAVIYNLIECDNADNFQSNNLDTLSIGLLSSNIEKKGVGDFMKLACLLEDTEGLIFKVYGPKTAYLEMAMAQQQKNLEYCGYTDIPGDAIKSLDVVLSLSHFAESFGRTVAEAQCFGKVSIAYNKGAVSELIRNGETGFLTPPGDIEAVSQHLLALKEKPMLRRLIGKRAKKFALTTYSEDALLAKISSFYENLK